MTKISKTLYGVDCAEWNALTAELDAAHVAEEIEDLGISEFKAAQSYFVRRLTKLIRQNIQPEHDGASWRQFL